jgi:hypothetical protein
VTGSFDGTRIGEGAFDWLKAGESAGKTAKQAEIGVGKLPKILSIRPAVPDRPATHSGGLSLILG